MPARDSIREGTGHPSWCQHPADASSRHPIASCGCADRSSCTTLASRDTGTPRYSEVVPGTSFALVRRLTCTFLSPLQGEGRGFESLSAHEERWLSREESRKSHEPPVPGPLAPGATGGPYSAGECSTGWRVAVGGRAARVHLSRRRTPADDADVHAFLIADVRGWTSFTQERGDEDGARLAARFAEVTRAVVEDHRGTGGRAPRRRGPGRVRLATLGDPRGRGPAAAVRRGDDRRSIAPAHRGDRARRRRGGARRGRLPRRRLERRRTALLARAKPARCSRAGRSSTSPAASTASGSPSAARLQLKGLDQPVHVVAVRSEHRDAAEAIAPFVRSTAPPPPHSGGRWSRPWSRSPWSPRWSPSRCSQGRGKLGDRSELDRRLDPESGEVTATMELEERPGSVAASADAVWVTNPDVGTVTRIDPNEQEVRDTIQVGENPTGIAVGVDAVWVVDSGGPSVSRISPDTNQVVDTIEVGNGPADIAVGEGSVWVTNRFDGTISRIDPDGGEVVKTIPVGLDPRGIAVGFGSVWVGLAGSNTVVRIDPADERGDEADRRRERAGVAGRERGRRVGREHPRRHRLADQPRHELGRGHGPGRETAPRVSRSWMGSCGWRTKRTGRSRGSSPVRRPAARMVIGSVPQGLAGVNGDLWVSVRGTATSHRGGTLRMVSAAARGVARPGGRLRPMSHGACCTCSGTVWSRSSRSVGPTPHSCPTWPPPYRRRPTAVERTPSSCAPGIRYSNGEVVAPSRLPPRSRTGFPSRHGRPLGPLRRARRGRGLRERASNV